MLVLTRRVGEVIVIHETIKVKVISVKGVQVRLGLDAPKEINIRREELKPQEAQK